MAYGSRVAFEALREVDFGSIGASYTAVGPPLNNHVRLISLQNSMNQDLYVSFDGVTDHLRLAENSFKLLDLSSNKVRDDGLFLAIGTQIYVKEVSATPTNGTVWIEVLHAEGGI